MQYQRWRCERKQKSNCETVCEYNLLLGLGDMGNKHLLLNMYLIMKYHSAMDIQTYRSVKATILPFD